MAYVRPKTPAPPKMLGRSQSISPGIHPYAPSPLRRASFLKSVVVRVDTLPLERLLVALVLCATLTTVSLYPFVFPPASIAREEARLVHARPLSLPPLPTLHGLSRAAMDAAAASVAIDALMRPKYEVCFDPYGLFEPETKLLRMLDDMATYHTLGPPQLQRLRSGRYFFAALMRDDEDIFPFWQRELIKALLLVGNADRSNLFVSVLEIGSKDKTKICALALKDTLTMMGVANTITTDPRGAPIDPHRDLPGLRNSVLAPLYAAKVPYDAVVHVSLAHFCGFYVPALLAVAQGGGGSGGGGGGGSIRGASSSSSSAGADVVCSMDYAQTNPGGNAGASLEAVDLWTARDRGGCNMVGRRPPHWCDAGARAQLAAGLPVPLFSCWDSVTVTKADLFQKLGLRFRVASDLECRQSETDLFCREAWSVGRGNVFMLPGAATALEWATFAKMAEEWQRQGVYNGTGSMPFDVAALAGTSVARRQQQQQAAPPPPAAVTCCPIDDEENTVRLKECFEDRHWANATDVVRIVGAETVVAAEPAGNAALGKAVELADGSGQESESTADGGGSHDAADATHPRVQAITEDLQHYIEHQKRSAHCTNAREGAGGSLAVGIPQRVVHFGGPAGSLARDVENRLVLSAVSFAVAHEGCYDYVMVTDEQLLSMAAELAPFIPESARDFTNTAAGPLHGWLRAVPRAEMRIDLLRLLYMLKHGGVMAPPLASAIGPVEPHLWPGDALVLGFTEAAGAPHLLFMAVAPNHPVVSDMVERAFRAMRDPLQLYRLRSTRGFGAADSRERYFSSGLGVMLEAVRAQRGDGGDGKSTDVAGVRAVRFPSELAARYVGRPRNLCHSGVVVGSGSASGKPLLQPKTEALPPPFVLDVRLYSDKSGADDAAGEGVSVIEYDDDYAAAAAAAVALAGGVTGAAADSIVRVATKEAWPGIRRSLRLSDGGVVRATADFDFLRDERALMRGQWLPTWSGDLSALGLPLWESLPLTLAERESAAGRDAEKEFYAAVDDATCALELFAGAGPLDPTRKRLRTLSAALAGGALSGTDEKKPLKAPECFLQMTADAGLQLQKLRRTPPSPTTGEGVWADPIWTPPGRYSEPRRGERAHVLLRRDGRLAAYAGASPPQSTSSFDPQIGDDVAAWVDGQCQLAHAAWREAGVYCPGMEGSGLAGQRASKACFDASRCASAGTGSLPQLSVYVYDSVCSLRGSSELLQETLSQASRYGAEGEVESDRSSVWRTEAARVGILAETPAEACLLLYVLPEDLEDSMGELGRRGIGAVAAGNAGGGCLNQASTWNGGLNHVIVSEGLLPPYRLARWFGSAAVATVHPLACAHRHGFDISLPPPAPRDAGIYSELGDAALKLAQEAVADKTEMGGELIGSVLSSAADEEMAEGASPDLASESASSEHAAVTASASAKDLALDGHASNSRNLQSRDDAQRKLRRRRYLATFEGVFRVGGFATGYVPGTQRGRLWQLDNGADIRVFMECHGDASPRHDVERLCRTLGSDATDPYRPSTLELLNSTFAFVPGGRRPSPRRLAEVMLAGCVPVMYSDGYVPPLAELIDWSSLSLSFDTRSEGLIVPTLRTTTVGRAVAMGAAAVAAARRFLSDDAFRYEHVYSALAKHVQALS